MLKICIWGWLKRWEFWPNPPESEVKWNGWQAHRQPEGNLLLRLVIWEAEVDGSYNIGRPEIFRWIMRVMVSGIFNYQKKCWFPSCCKGWLMIRPIENHPIIENRKLLKHQHPSIPSIRQLTSTKEWPELSQTSRTGETDVNWCFFFQSFRYVSLTVETSNES